MPRAAQIYRLHRFLLAGTIFSTCPNPLILAGHPDQEQGLAWHTTPSPDTELLHFFFLFPPGHTVVKRGHLISSYPSRSMQYDLGHFFLF